MRIIKGMQITLTKSVEAVAIQKVVEFRKAMFCKHSNSLQTKRNPAGNGISANIEIRYNRVARSFLFLAAHESACFWISCWGATPFEQKEKSPMFVLAMREARRLPLETVIWSSVTKKRSDSSDRFLRVARVFSNFNQTNLKSLGTFQQSDR